MANIKPRDIASEEQFDPLVKMVEAGMGFVPNSMGTMAHMNQLPFVFSALFATIMGADAKVFLRGMLDTLPDQENQEDNLDPELLQLIAYCVSLSSGCLYCQAHTSHSAHRIESARFEARFSNVLNSDEADCYSQAEKSAIQLALAAGKIPNEVSEDHFAAIRKYFTERQQAQILGVISIFGFLNRWNDTNGTALEEKPLVFAQEMLSSSGWSHGKHGF